MEDYYDHDDLGLYCAFIKSVTIDYSEKIIRIEYAKAVDDKYKEYNELEIRISNIRYANCESNLEDEEVPEFYRSAIVTNPKQYKLEKEEKLFYFGVDWGAKYLHWHIIGKSYEIVKNKGPIKEEDLNWVK
jgi:hypothetical protein